MANGLDDDEEQGEEPRLEEGRSRRKRHSVAGILHQGSGELAGLPARAGASTTLSVLGVVTVVGVVGSAVGLLTVDAGSRTAIVSYATAIVAGLLTLVAVAAAVSARRHRRVDVAIVAERIEALVRTAQLHPNRDWASVVWRERTLGEDAFALALDVGASAEAARLVHALAGLREIEARR